MRPNKKKLVLHQLSNLLDMNYELYALDAEKLIEYINPSNFTLMVKCEPFDLGLAKLLADLIEKFIEIEEYLYAVPIRDWFRKYDTILRELLLPI